MSRVEHVVVGMSGGVDSSVAAALLLRQGYRVSGVTLHLFGEQDTTADEASAVARQLGVDHQVIDGRQPFEQRVLRSCWETYAAGRTPNPCALCNPTVKFELMTRAADELGADRIATGHYARLLPQESRSKGPLGPQESRSKGPLGPQESRSKGPLGPQDAEELAPAIWRGSDRQKDQSYFLCRLTARQRRRTLLPLGLLTKPRVRELARQLGLASADSAESQDACLALEEEQLAEVLRRHFAAAGQSGTFVDPQGQLLGQHEGVHRFTIGQRKGLGIALGQRAYVTAIDAARGEVTVSTDQQHLLSAGMLVEQVQWHVAAPAQSFEAEVQVRYRHRSVAATVVVESEGDQLTRVQFHEPVSAVTPGQAAAFYRGEQLLGGGWIVEALRS